MPFGVAGPGRGGGGRALEGGGVGRGGGGLCPVRSLGVGGQGQGVGGLAVEAGELALAIGSLCRIRALGGKTSLAEVIGFAGEKTLLMPLTGMSGVSRGDRIENVASSPRVWCSEQLL